MWDFRAGLVSQGYLAACKASPSCNCWTYDIHVCHVRLHLVLFIASSHWTMMSWPTMTKSRFEVSPAKSDVLSTKYVSGPLGQCCLGHGPNSPEGGCCLFMQKLPVILELNGSVRAQVLWPCTWIGKLNVDSKRHATIVERSRTILANSRTACRANTCPLVVAGRQPAARAVSVAKFLLLSA